MSISERKNGWCKRILCEKSDKDVKKEEKNSGKLFVLTEECVIILNTSQKNSKTTAEKDKYIAWGY